MRFKWIKSSKRSNQEKATPKMAPRYAGYPRRWHRNREASELASLRQRTLLFPISAPATWRHQRGFTATATATATSRATSRATSTATSRATSRATATVAARNVKGNRNGRCAGKGNCNARMEPLSGRTLLTASMLPGLVGLSAAQHSGRRTRQPSASTAAPNVGLPAPAPNYQGPQFA